MEERGLLATAAVLFVALIAVTVYPTPLWESTGLIGALQPYEDAEKPGEDSPNKFVHKHARLNFLIDGERKNMTDEYIERDHIIHFHHDDGILHIEGKNANLSAAFQTLDIEVDETCIRYGLDNETYCAENGKELRLVINEEPVSIEEGLDRTIQQDDTIVLLFGEKSEEIPENYFEPLPSEFKPTYNQL